VTLRVSPAEVVAYSKSPLVSIAPWWERIRLRDLVEVTNGAPYKSALFNTDGRGLPVIRIRDVGKPSASSFYDGDYEERHVVEHGDLLVGMDGDFRAARWAGPRSLLNQRVCRLRLRSEVDYSAGLLTYVLQPYLDEIHKVTSVVTVKHLSSKTIEDLPVPLPPRAEQERVVAAIEEHLSRLNAAEASLARAAARSATLHTHVAREAACGWPLVQLGEVSEVFVGSTPARSDPALWDGSIPWVSSGEVSFCRIRVTRESISSSAVRPERVHPPGTVLLGMIGEGKTRGQAAILEVSASHNQNSAAIRPDRSQLSSEWLFHHFRASYEANRRVGSGNNQPALNKKRVAELEVPLPPLAEQERLTAQLDAVEADAHRLESGVDRAGAFAQALRCSILSAAFSGRLVPQDPSDEPADVLLAHIAEERSSAGTKSRGTASRRPG